MRYVVVFDTNILISGTGWRGLPYQCLELARAGIVAGVTCPELLDELRQKLRTKLHFTDDKIVETITDLLGFLQVVAITNTLQGISTDPDDDKVLECALAGNASHIVTGDRRHLLPLHSYQNITIVTAADFLTLVSAVPPA